jgi:long-chain fatty acid transport protein
MKNIQSVIRLSLALYTTSLFATNGDYLIGLGPKSRAMGGAGIAYSLGAESALVNPALIEGKRVMFGGSYFSPTVEFKSSVNTTSVGGTNSNPLFQESDKGVSLIPEVAISYQIDKETAWGVGMFGIAGMGVDYYGDQPFYGNPFLGHQPSPQKPQNEYIGTKNGTNQLTTSLQILSFALPYAKKLNDELRIGIVPVIQYGSLSMSFNSGAYQAKGDGSYQNVHTGTGTSDDVGFGAQFGLGYNVQDFEVKKVKVKNLSLGLVVKTPIKMHYAHQLSDATKAFGIEGFSDDLTQPGEIGLGLAYKLSKNQTLLFDYKNIMWGSASGYEDFGWENQNVFAIGYEKLGFNWTWRAGYNYAKSPIKELASGPAFDQDGFNYQNYKNAVINYFNLSGFPAVAEHHFTFGGGKRINQHTSFDFAFVYAPQVEKSFDTSALAQAQTAGMAGGESMPSSVQRGLGGVHSISSVNHNQFSITVGLNIKYY